MFWKNLNFSWKLHHCELWNKYIFCVNFFTSCCTFRAETCADENWWDVAWGNVFVIARIWVINTRKVSFNELLKFLSCWTVILWIDNWIQWICGCYIDSKDIRRLSKFNKVKVNDVNCHSYLHVNIQELCMPDTYIYFHGWRIWWNRIYCMIWNRRVVAWHRYPFNFIVTFF